MLLSGEKRAVSVTQATCQQCFQINDWKSFNNTVKSLWKKSFNKLTNNRRMACAWVWFLRWTTWNITVSTDMVISNDSSSSSCIKAELLFYPLLQAKQQLRRPRFKKHQKNIGHLASQTYIVLIFPLCSAFLAILQITSMPYSIQHLLWSCLWEIFFQFHF